MGVVQYLAALADLKGEHGGVTTLDAKRNDLFVGTDQGYVLHYKVEFEDSNGPSHGGLPLERGTEVLNGRSGDDNVEGGKTDGANVFTSLLGGIQISTEREPISFLQCSQKHSILFVLCDCRLIMLDIDTWREVSIVPHSNVQRPAVSCTLPQEMMIAHFCVVEGISPTRLAELQSQCTVKRDAQTRRCTSLTPLRGSADTGCSIGGEEGLKGAESISSSGIAWEPSDVFVMVLSTLDAKRKQKKNDVRVVYLVMETALCNTEFPSDAPRTRVGIHVKMIHMVDVPLGPAEVVAESLSPVGQQGVVIRWRKGLKFLRLEGNDHDNQTSSSAPFETFVHHRGGGGDPLLWPLPLPVAIKHSPQSPPPLISVSRDEELVVCVDDVIFSCSLGNAFAPTTSQRRETPSELAQRKLSTPQPQQEKESNNPNGIPQAECAPSSIGSVVHSESPPPQCTLSTTPGNVPRGENHPRQNTDCSERVSPVVLPSKDADNDDDEEYRRSTCSQPHAPQESTRAAAPLILSWNRSRRVEQETVRCIAVHYPHILQFSANTCSITEVNLPQVALRETGLGESSFTRQSAKSVHIPQITVVVSPYSAKPHVYAASRTTLWMIVMEPMSSQWASLVEADRMFTALRWCEREWSRGFIAPTVLRGMEEELRYRAGFQLLYRGRVQEGMDFLDGAMNLDVRELCCLIPECLPPVRDAEAPHATRREEGDGHGCTWRQSTAENGYWAEWHVNGFNANPSRLEASWREAYRARQRRSPQKEEVVYSHSKQSSSPASSMNTAVHVFLEDCWCALKERAESFILNNRERFFSGPQSRAAAYALLVLALERRDWAAAHTCCLSPHLSVKDAYDLLSSLCEFRLLACVLWRSGRHDEADQLIRSRLYLSGLLVHDRRNTDCVAELTCPVFVKRHSTTDSAGSSMVVGTPPSAVQELEPVGVVGVGWLSLPQRMREWTATHLFGLSCCSSSVSLPLHDENTNVETEEDRWIHRMAVFCQRRQDQAVSLSKAQEEHSLLSNQGVKEGAGVSDSVNTVVSPPPLEDQGKLAEGVREHRKMDWKLPSTLSLELVLLDHLDLDALRARFTAHPSAVLQVDGEGSGFLLLVFGLLLLRGGLLSLDGTCGDDDGDDDDDGAADASEADACQRECLREAVMCGVECLLDAGCPTDCINIHGWSCLDVLTAADPLHADEFVAAMLSVKAVMACVHQEQ